MWRSKIKRAGGDSNMPSSRIMQHYHARCNRTREDRETSPILNLKKLHGWIKSVLIRRHVAAAGEAVRALDLACGKGADLASWKNAGARYYVGVDVVRPSLEEAQRRYAELNISNGGSSSAKEAGFHARFLCEDCFSPKLPCRIRANMGLQFCPFDVCSCMFALHYSWSTEAQARVAMANVASLLRPGGFFIGTILDADVAVARLGAAQGTEFGNCIYHIRFDQVEYAKIVRCVAQAGSFGIQYEFHLVDAVDHCPEWLVPFDALKKLAREHGLELVFKKNFKDFVNEQMEGRDINKLLHSLGAHGNISIAEWECVSIYLAFAFQKK